MDEIQSTPRASKIGRIPGLDGVRAFAVSLVLFGHLCGTRNFLSEAWANGIGDLANLGVRIFFVLSGFLITKLLIEERERTGSISLGKFFARRALRILPPFYAYLAALALAWFLGLVALKPADIAYATAFLTNYQRDPSWFVAHGWSLAVEEQFYLIWPSLFFLLQNRWARGFLFVALVVAPFVRLGTWIVFPQARWMIGKAFFSNYDALASGCLLAFMRESKATDAALSRAKSSSLKIVPVLTILAHAMEPNFFGWIGYARETIVNLGIALSLDGILRLSAQSRAMRILNHRIVTRIGILSYSLYLWQEPFLNRQSTAWFAAFPMNLALAFGAAWLSYEVLERPFIRMRERFRS